MTDHEVSKSKQPFLSFFVMLGFGYRVLKDPVCPLLSICLTKSDGKVDVNGDSTFYDTH